MEIPLMQCPQCGKSSWPEDPPWERVSLKPTNVEVPENPTEMTYFLDLVKAALFDTLSELPATRETSLIVANATGVIGVLEQLSENGSWPTGPISKRLFGLIARSTSGSGHSYPCDYE